MANVNPEALTKKVAINRANAQVVTIMGVAAFLTVFCLMGAKAVWSENSYQSRVISATSKANTQLQANLTSYNQLESSYEKFVTKPTNVLGGQTSGSSQNDGNNAKLILDALPAAYDFPGLTSTLGKILSNGSYKLTSISGTDEQLTEQSNNSSANPQPVAMPFTFTISNSNYQSVTQLIHELQESTRPIDIQSITMSGGSNDVSLTVVAQTYYQPSKNLSITKQEVK